MPPKRTVFAASLLLLLATLPAFAQTKDIPGSKDSPLVSRYPGSVISNYKTHAFDEYLFPIGAVTAKGEPKSQIVEGKITRIEYTNPAGRSSLEIDRNYETALKSAGFETVFSCKADACGLARFHATPDWADVWYGAGHFQFSGKLSRPEGDLYISLHVSNDTTVLDTIETKAMESGLVLAAALKSDITKTGHVAVYGIHFDTAKSDLKPDSQPAIQEIVKLLQQDPRLKLFVVGHTDNVGPLAGNLDLSKRRSLAVIQSLTAQGIDAARLESFGAGPYAPVSTNESDAGRALNRRVELVRQ
jgi:outer membrane protein OmpA-like peptidoglycan-associated protein